MRASESKEHWPTESMEDSFSVRVDKVFGALRSDATVASASASVGVTPALWSLTDEEIERREWNRDKPEDEPGGGVESGPSPVGNPMLMDLQELSDEEDGDEGEEDEGIDGEKKRRRNSGGGSTSEISADEYLEVQSNIGRDCTLDYEEEEDEYDKVAVGTEDRVDPADRIYMKDVKVVDYGVDEPSAYGELPNSFHDVVRDPRANHAAAKLRLKEDAEAAGNFDTLQLSDNSVVTKAEAGDHKKEDDGNNPKPILKKSESSLDSRAQKRVRFSVDPKSSTRTQNYDQSSGGSGLKDGSAAQQQTSDLSQYSSGIPDYVRNPSKYTRYTFNSSEDVDDKSNQKAYAELFQYLRKKDTDTSLDNTPVEIPKSVTFIPKRRTQDGLMEKRADMDHNMQDDHKSKNWSIGVTAEDIQESETSAMEEDEPSAASGSNSAMLPKPGRQYRGRTNIDAEVP